jgi:endonuclease/exonuclease/phosphatase family metal-dependent hydrolase
MLPLSRRAFSAPAPVLGYAKAAVPGPYVSAVSVPAPMESAPTRLESEAPTGARAASARASGARLRLLSYNIQAGVYTRNFTEYVTKGWKQWLPHRERLLNLNRIAEMLHDYDLVGLQEVDSGSLRSGFVDQTEYLAHRGRFPHWYGQVNRNMGKIAQHSNGMLSRLRPARVMEHRLPGLPGRGAIVVELATSDGGLLGVCIIHLALGRRARGRQLAYIADLLVQYPYLVVMGDFNCNCESRELRDLMEATELRGPSCEMKTFPSWRPTHNLDHILVSPRIAIDSARVLDYPMSDHLPVSMELHLPSGVTLST